MESENPTVRISSGVCQNREAPSDCGKCLCANSGTDYGSDNGSLYGGIFSYGKSLQYSGGNRHWDFGRSSDFWYGDRFASMGPYYLYERAVASGVRDFRTLSDLLFYERDSGSQDDGRQGGAIAFGDLDFGLCGLAAVWGVGSFAGAGGGFGSKGV